MEPAEMTIPSIATAEMRRTVSMLSPATESLRCQDRLRGDLLHNRHHQRTTLSSATATR